MCVKARRLNLVRKGTMKRATLLLSVAMCTLNVSDRSGVAEANATASHAPHAIAIEVLIVGTKGGIHEEHAIELSGPADTVAAQVRALESKGQIVFLDRIRLTTLENHKTLVQSGVTTPVASGRTFGGRGGTSFQQRSVGTLISATARVEGDAIVVELEVEKSGLKRHPDQSLSDDEFVPQGTETLTSQATVRIGSGMTVLASGLESRADAGSSGR
jgi:type II secretory pathway component GspD/PulD (secretin)